MCCGAVLDMNGVLFARLQLEINYKVATDDQGQDVIWRGHVLHLPVTAWQACCS